MSPVPRFKTASPFGVAIRRCLDEYWRSTPLERHARRYRLKVGVLLAWLTASYLGLVFMARGPWQITAAMGSLVLAAAAVSFNVMHDAAHGAASAARPVNRTLAMTLDLLGGSSYVWHWKHNVLHHTFPNVEGVDTDIDLWPFARTSVAQPAYWIHRYQHVYMWALYGLVPFEWYVADARFLLTGRLHGHRFPRPQGRALLTIFAGKLVYVCWALAIPMAYHSAAAVFLVWLLCLYCLGLILAITFQLAHCVQGTAFTGAGDGTSSRRTLDSDWFMHQLRTTANFASGNRVLTWYLGGLNHQIEHHLFPSVCHVHYPMLAPWVQQTCARFGVPYVAHRTLADAVASHYHWLRRHAET
jgi:linoleoyl-CoA desaturase